MICRLNSILQQAEHADGDQHVMQQRQHGAGRELPLEAEPHVDQNADDGRDHGDDALLGEFGRDLGAHHLDGAELDAGAQRLLHLGDGRLLRLRRRPRRREGGSARRWASRTPGSRPGRSRASSPARAAARCWRAAAVRMVITVPPLKSTPTLRPTKMKSSTEASDRRPEKKKPKRLSRMIGNLGVVRNEADGLEFHGVTSALRAEPPWAWPSRPTATR